jgi:hypothetical protein
LKAGGRGRTPVERIVLRLGGSVRVETASGSHEKSVADFVARMPQTIYDRSNLTLRAILNHAGRQADGSVVPSTFRQFRRRQAAHALVEGSRPVPRQRSSTRQPLGFLFPRQGRPVVD